MIPEIEHIEDAIRTLRLTVVDYASKAITKQFLIYDVDYAIEQLQIAKDLVYEIEQGTVPINGWNCIECVYVAEAVKLVDGAITAYDWGKIPKDDMLKRLDDARGLLMEAREIVAR